MTSSGPMTFREALQSHKGGLIRIRSEIFWYDRGVWDRSPDRVCLLLDAVTDAPSSLGRGGTATSALRRQDTRTAAHLLIDGSPQWVWVVEKDVEMIDEAR